METITESKVALGLWR